MQISDGPLTFNFHDHWARIPDTPSGRENGRTHGVTALPDGRVVVFHQASPGLLVFDADGRLLSSAGEGYLGAHGLTPAAAKGEPTFWVTDQEACTVERIGLDGEVLQSLAAPPAEAQPDGKYVPTWADVAPDGAIVVADGYGGSALHRYDADGTYRDSLTSVGAAGRLKCPHAIRFDADGVLWVADRGNERVLKLDAGFNVIAESDTACHSPCGFAFHDGHAYVPELLGGLKVLDGDLNVVASLGQNPAVHPDVDGAREKLGWPNADASEIKPGVFNSPHGCDVDADGNVYVVEWIVGGRIIKLQKV